MVNYHRDHFSEPEDAAVAGNASTRCGYDGRFGRLDGKLPKMPEEVSTMEIGPLWSINLLYLVWMPIISSSVAIFSDRSVYARLRSRCAGCWVHFRSR